MHEESIFTSRTNFFLLSETLLLIAFVFLWMGAQPHLILYSIPIAGFILVSIWIYVQAWQMASIDAIKRQLREVDDTYRDTARLRGQPLLSVRWLVSRLVPSVFGALWIMWIVLLYLG